MARKQVPVEEVSETWLDEVERKVRHRGAVASRQLPARTLSEHARQSMYEKLAQRGLEHTGKHVRVPLPEQIRALLHEKEHLPFQALKRRVKGAANVTELRKAVGDLHARGVVCFVMEGRKEIVAKPSDAVVPPDELARLRQASDDLAKLLRTARASKGRPMPTLWRSHVQKALAPLEIGETTPVASDHHGVAADGRAARGLVLDAIGRLQGRDGPLVFVPAVARALGERLEIRAIHQALLDTAKAGEVELRPESGVGTLSSADAALCPRGPGGTVLSYARLRGPR